VLRVRGLSRSFGGLRVVDAVSLDVAAGSALGIVGPNGAGKTTLLNLLDGVLPAGEGRIELDGRDVTRAPAAQRCRAGVIGANGAGKTTLLRAVAGLVPVAYGGRIELDGVALHTLRPHERAGAARLALRRAVVRLYDLHGRDRRDRHDRGSGARRGLWGVVTARRDVRLLPTGYHVRHPEVAPTSFEIAEPTPRAAPKRRTDD
jgi:ABC-type uncharacterized transport system ATPase subunit